MFISYAHEDGALLEQLHAHLGALKRDGLIDAWDDRKIPPGDDWVVAIDERLNRADIVLLVVTTSFMESNYCHDQELKRALERRADAQDRVIVIPVILQKCVWRIDSLKRLTPLPKPLRPLAEWPTDDYFTAIAEGLRRRILKLRTLDDRWSERVGRRLRNPRWWRQPWILVCSFVLPLTIASMGWVWWQAAQRADADVVPAVHAFRIGRYSDAVKTLEPVCERLINRGACFALDKARLAAGLEQAVDLRRDLSRFAARVEALKAQVPNDPDLLLISAELSLFEGRADLRAAAFDDIRRAISLTGGDYPEAYFYLADLKLSKGQFADALPLLDQALVSSNVGPAHYLNARAFARFKTGDVSGAIEDYELSAERGSILSRIELASLFWRGSEFDRAADQLRAASLALPMANGSLDALNDLPWKFKMDGGGSLLMLTEMDEKRCLARWMTRAGYALAARNDAEATPANEGKCGPKAMDIRAAVGTLLADDARNGMDATGQQRAAAFARKHHLPWKPSEEAR